MKGIGEQMKVILVAHGELATAFHNTLQMIVGDVNHYIPINFYDNDGIESLRERMLEVIDLNSGEDYIIFTDLFGGTPFNVSSMLASEDENISVIAGTNLPMLLEIAFSVDEPRDVLVKKAMEAGGYGVKEFVVPRESDSDGDDLDDSF